MCPFVARPFTVLYKFKEKSYLETFVAEDYELSGTCKFSFTYEDFFKVNLAFPLPKGSPLKPLMDKK
jgi:hypothetical protein